MNIHNMAKIVRPALAAAFFFFAAVTALPGGGCEARAAAKGGVSGDPDTDRLRSLPYLLWSPVGEDDREKSGVTIYDRGRSAGGFNVYNSRAVNRAYLMDMEGREMHEWSGGSLVWHTVTADSEGNLFAIDWGDSLVKLDRDSNVIWKNELRFHHCITVADNGDIYTLTMRDVNVRFRGKGIPLLNDYITILDKNGALKKTISVYKLVGDRIPDKVLQRIKRVAPKRDKTAQLREGTAFDVFHTNAVKIIGRDVEGVCRKGDLLVSVRNLSLIMVVSPKNNRLKWLWGPGVIDNQHDPSLLENGNILLFDNGRYRGKSRVIEMDPRDGAIKWQYPAEPDESFFSEYRGAAQKLPNGNVMITHSDVGRALEVTPGGDVVWEFFNPDRNSDGERAIIYKMIRLEPGEAENILGGQGSRPDEADRRY